MIAWIIEPDVFSDNDSRLAEAAISQGHEVIYWKDQWARDGVYPVPKNKFVVFHGSLGNAAQITAITYWKPGAYCSTEKFYCSTWYAECKDWLLNKTWVCTTVTELVRDPESIFKKIGADNSVFVRPDSPLKPFSGRVIHKDKVSLKALDFGFYYSDENLPIVVAPVRNITREWRFIVIKRQVTAGSEYVADGRSEAGSLASGKEWDLAQSIATHITPPDDAYVLDLCEAEGAVNLLEINPFSGADLYECDRNAVVASMARLASKKSRCTSKENQDSTGISA
ncbi:MAG TPA: ATP-grasp domain-containing protein [Longilinea sp.]|nr:ATP-grasp domain-containing protein [Longilinea sp.]